MAEENAILLQCPQSQGERGGGNAKYVLRPLHYVSGHWIKELKSFEKKMHFFGSIFIQIWKF